MEDGTKFTYTNNFGGDWAYDPTNPFAAGGLSQSWSKRVGSEDWVWGSDYVRGVNLGYVNFKPGIFMMALSFFAEDG